MITAIRLLIALGLLFYGCVKLLFSRQFQAHLATYNVLPRQVLTWGGRALPFIEIAAGTALLFRPTWRVGAWFALALYGMFAGLVLSALVNGKKGQPCGCGKNGKISWSLLFRDVAVAALAAWLVYISK
jgi:cbb3-type cytochrome oxidase subunit 3